ncbi:MAG TPA: GAP family protein [Solirubrobacterales bacterium]|jgi:hypothetical protein|nr:GAP family protein [Solirubrobacterales bacterium]
MEHIFVLAIVSAVNASLLAAVTVMLFLPDPKRLLLGYLAGALLTSLTIGFVIVFVVHNSSATSSGESTVSPAIDLVLGTVLLIVAFVLHGGHDERLKERRRQKKLAERGGEELPEKRPSKVEQLLGRGSARITFALGVVLTLPGVAYLAALRDVQDHGYSAGGKVLVILAYNVMLMLLLEIPLVGFYLAPDRTVVEVHRFRDWLSRNGRRMAIVVAATVAVFLIVRGAVELLV